ncbi:hypothetical protein OS493_012883 [Desmophyllum pertusum]|uniref:Uncharacterized protein n=1 Tax=Desmophyllum pertusum TaxID=174260 RepID=A0A9W9Z176_9CNID|nr:hypothetical protein OS493_012883 [Desmophyllum pertusum]
MAVEDILEMKRARRKQLAELLLPEEPRLDEVETLEISVRTSLGSHIRRFQKRSTVQWESKRASAKITQSHLSRRLEKDSPAAKFYSKLKFGIQSKLTPIGQDIFKLGAASRCILDETIKPKLLQVLGLIPFGTVKKFNRIKIGRQVFHGKAYSRVSKRNSYTVVYKKREDQVEYYGQIQFFLLHQPPPCEHGPLHLSCQSCKETSLAVIWRLEPEITVQFADCESEITVNHIQAVKKPRADNVEVIDVSSVKEKCVYVEFQGISHAYISKFPNFIETD